MNCRYIEIFCIISIELKTDLIFEYYLKKEYFKERINCVIVYILREQKKRSLIVLLVIAIITQIVFQSLILSFDLFVRLKVKSLTQFMFNANTIAKRQLIVANKQ